MVQNQIRSSDEGCVFPHRRGSLNRGSAVDTDVPDLDKKMVRQSQQLVKLVSNHPYLLNGGAGCAMMDSPPSFIKKFSQQIANQNQPNFKCIQLETTKVATFQTNHLPSKQINETSVNLNNLDSFKTQSQVAAQKTQEINLSIISANIPQ